MVALVGESGGGKSTLTKLLPRFHDPTSGAVLWDGIDLREAKITSLRRQLALVTQETVLFNDTVGITFHTAGPTPPMSSAQCRPDGLAHDSNRAACVTTRSSRTGLFYPVGSAAARDSACRPDRRSELILDEATSAWMPNGTGATRHREPDSDRTPCNCASFMTVRRAICRGHERVNYRPGHACRVTGTRWTLPRLYELQFATRKGTSE